ncbi:hypothetical protein [Pseudoalteromonas maricaloris]|uniref:hypothetical protein n=1 Tax=Pseudoalteromonas maricaloris TaxID=184924 RepID=UPI00057FB6A8|nr:hypothetical protein [Pseudoalteromonas flavipulchra]KID36083.1 hypothetical protein QT15_10685 [Pseudoalteromonas flavipulchra NCIMB 2033 = ATCC BAA-314]MBD0780250.1 hypothetical protein [Pseudoalteromonas flavipulchra]MBE0371499.1 hypothetical protein [Pseudoalteromonas flavipulchra NCIMB 2033 = ATCC BAA-314]
MSQQQRQVPLVFQDLPEGLAIATGNNAAWLCHCSRTLPLLGKAGQIKGASDNTKVTCEECNASYFVVPDGGDYKRAVAVKEI